MFLKVLAFAVVGLPMALGSARAETIVLSPSSYASIGSRDAEARFLSGAFLPVPANWTDGSKSSPAASEPDEEVTSPAVQQSAAGKPPGKPATSRTIPDAGALLGGEEESHPPSGQGITLDPTGGAPTTSVGTVPLPAALPMFGGALLGLAGLGIRVRRRRTTRA